MKSLFCCCCFSPNFEGINWPCLHDYKPCWTLDLPIGVGNLDLISRSQAPISRSQGHRKGKAESSAVKLSYAIEYRVLTVQDCYIDRHRTRFFLYSLIDAIFCFKYMASSQSPLSILFLHFRTSLTALTYFKVRDGF